MRPPESCFPLFLLLLAASLSQTTARTCLCGAEEAACDCESNPPRTRTLSGLPVPRSTGKTVSSRSLPLANLTLSSHARKSTKIPQPTRNSSIKTPSSERVITSLLASPSASLHPMSQHLSTTSPSPSFTTHDFSTTIYSPSSTTHDLSTTSHSPTSTSPHLSSKSRRLPRVRRLLPLPSALKFKKSLKPFRKTIRPVASKTPKSKQSLLIPSPLSPPSAESATNHRHFQRRSPVVSKSARSHHNLSSYSSAKRKSPGNHQSPFLPTSEADHDENKPIGYILTTTDAKVPYAVNQPVYSPFQGQTNIQAPYTIKQFPSQQTQTSVNSSVLRYIQVPIQQNGFYYFSQPFPLYYEQQVESPPQQPQQLPPQQLIKPSINFDRIASTLQRYKIVDNPDSRVRDVKAKPRDDIAEKYQEFLEGQTQPANQWLQTTMSEHDGTQSLTIDSKGDQRRRRIPADLLSGLPPGLVAKVARKIAGKLPPPTFKFSISRHPMPAEDADATTTPTPLKHRQRPPSIANRGLH